METIESLLNHWEIDSEIDRTEPGKASIDIPKLHSKYLKILLSAKAALTKYKNEYSKIKKLKWEYYRGHLNTNKELLKEKGWEPFKFVLKDDIGTYLDADDDLIKAKDKITYYEEMIKACELIITELGKRSWQIRAYIDWEKFINGSN